MTITPGISMVRTAHSAGYGNRQPENRALSKDITALPKIRE